MSEIEKKALIPNALVFTIEIPLRVVMTNKAVSKLGLDITDFYNDTTKVRRLAEELRQELFARVRQELIPTTHHCMNVVKAEGVLDGGMKLDIDIEDCGLGESAV